MKTYTVTTEVNENLWRKFLRRIKINKKGNFQIAMEYEGFKRGDLLVSNNRFVRVV